MKILLRNVAVACVVIGAAMRSTAPAAALDLDLKKYRGLDYYAYETSKIPSAVGVCAELWLSDAGPDLRVGNFVCGRVGPGGLKLLDKQHDWTTATAAYGPPGSSPADPAVRITLSRISPAVLVRGRRAIDLFAGTRTLQGVSEHSRVKPPATAAIPRWFALADGRVRPIAELAAGMSTDLEPGWILFWWGETAPCLEVFGHLGQEQSRRLDLPVLVVFGNNLKRIQATGAIAALPQGPGGASDPAIGVRFEFTGDDARLAVLPLYGKPVCLGGDEAPAADPAAPATNWKEKIPDEIVARAKFWAEHLAEVPLAVTKETVEYDSPGDTVTIRSTFAFERLREGGKRLAPLPITLAAAKAAGMKIAPSGAYVVAPLATPFGPYSGVEGTDTASYGISGLGKIALAQRKFGAGPVPKLLQDKLNAEADRILALGILDPPFYFLRHGPQDPEWYHQFRERLVFSNPGFNLYILAQLADAVDSERREKLVKLMKLWRDKYPPETVAHQPHGDARRERSPLYSPLADFKRWPGLDGNFHAYNKVVPIESVLYLAAYNAATGDKPDKTPTAMSAFYLAQTDWATGGYLRWGPLVKFRPEWGGQYLDHYYGRNFVLELNQLIAGMIGQIRIARGLGDAPAELEAWHALARAAMARVVVARAGLHSQCDERGLSGPMYCDQYANGFLVPYFELTPEVARLMHDHAQANVKQFCDEVARQVPDWHRTFCDVMWVGEQAFMYPTDADQVFACHALVLQDAPPAQLFKWCDLPWVPTGDLYYIRKLVETSRAYRGWKWE